ncbi:putative phage tail protein [Mesorhizobium muleiense]|uniref:putative phage tail protein n=1 Tax=Mesorhizobium muleiense TaxID=1004279 RepID=UPI003AFA0D08
MVTIQHLEVQFDVEGGEEEQLFVTLFNKYIEEWSRRQEAQRRVRDTMTRTRDLGDRDHEPGRGR